MDVYVTSTSAGYNFQVLATSELRKRPGKSEVDNVSRDCFRGRKQKARPQKQSRDALSTSLLPGLLRNSEVVNSAHVQYQKRSKYELFPEVCINCKRHSCHNYAMI